MSVCCDMTPFSACQSRVRSLTITGSCHRHHEGRAGRSAQSKNGQTREAPHVEFTWSRPGWSCRAPSTRGKFRSLRVLAKEGGRTNNAQGTKWGRSSPVCPPTKPTTTDRFFACLCASLACFFGNPKLSQCIHGKYYNPIVRQIGKKTHTQQTLTWVA